MKALILAALAVLAVCFFVYFVNTTLLPATPSPDGLARYQVLHEKGYTTPVIYNNNVGQK